MSEAVLKEKELVNSLLASDDKLVLNAIKQCRKEGNPKILKVILEVLNKTDEPDIEAEIISLLYDLKEQDNADIIAATLESNEMEFYNSFLISTFWQSSLDGSGFIELFVKKAVEGDYMTCLEALTVIENFDSSFAEETLMNLTADVEEAIEEEKDSEKKELLSSLLQVLKTTPIESE